MSGTFGWECDTCHARQPGWTAACLACGKWGVSRSTTPSSFTLTPASIVEQPQRAHPLFAERWEGRDTNIAPATPVAIDMISKSAEIPRVSTHIAELDRVLGGGIAPAALMFVAGDAGAGKSTLMSQVLSHLASDGKAVLYASGEESIEQIAMRARRIGAVAPGLSLVAETDVDRILALCMERRPQHLAIDSIQTVRTADVTGPAGTPGQVRECASRIAAFAKTTGTPTFLVGHITKDGDIGGPKTLEHLVDVVLYLEHDEQSGLRFLRGQKNRFGSTAELGIFEMRGDGIFGVEDASHRMLAYRDEAAAGSAIVPMLDGTRVVLVEIQALVTRTTMGGEDPAGRTIAYGLGASRAQIIRAVLERHADLGLHGYDVFVQVAGNVRVTEPAADLAVALAIASSRRDVPIAIDIAACGELGLTGEIRGVPMLEERIREATRMGFGRVIANSRDPLVMPIRNGVVLARRLADAIGLALSPIAQATSAAGAGRWPDAPKDPKESNSEPPTPELGLESIP